MRLAHLALLFACFALPMYFMGYTPPLMYIMNSQGNAPLDFFAIIGLFIQNMTNATFITNLFVILVGTALFTGFSAVYIIPAVILAIGINLVLIPSGQFISVAGVCAAGDIFCIPSLITLFMNLIVVLAIIEFISGR